MKFPGSHWFVSTKRPAGRRWGLDVIVLGYGIIALYCAYIAFTFQTSIRWSGALFAPLCLMISLGIAYRVNFVRVTLIVLAAVALLVDLAVLAVLIWKHRRVDDISLLVQIVLTFWLLAYLPRRDVREAFVVTAKK